MPRVFDEAGFVGRFYMADLDEPIHIHITKDGREAKFWIEPVSCATDGRFSRRDLRKAENMINKYRDDIITLWLKAKEARDNAGRTSSI